MEDKLENSSGFIILKHTELFHSDQPVIFAMFSPNDSGKTFPISAVFKK